MLLIERVDLVYLKTSIYVITILDHVKSMILLSYSIHKYAFNLNDILFTVSYHFLLP
jgi:hypothetical protein